MQTFNINCEKFPLYRTLAIIHLNIKKKKTTAKTETFG